MYAVSAMEELDADNQRLSAFGKYAERDIVQVGKDLTAMNI